MDPTHIAEGAVFGGNSLPFLIFMFFFFCLFSFLFVVASKLKD